MPTVPQKRLLPLTSTSPRELDVSIASKTKFAAPLYQPYLRSDSLHSPPQVLGTYCVHGVKIQNYPLPSAGSEDVAVNGGAQPKPRDTTSLQRRVWGSEMRLTSARATETHLQKKTSCKRTLSTTHTNQGCVHTVKCFHRGHTIPIFHITKNIKYQVAPNSGCVHTVKCLHRGPLSNFSQ